MISFDYKNLLHSTKIRTGIEPDQLTLMQEAVETAHAEIQQDRQQNILGFYDLPDQNVDHITSYIDSLGDRFDTMVVLGIGGSALGNKALYSALKTASMLKRKVLVYDNVDPVFLDEILDEITLGSTIFNVITKSGTTAETMASYMIVAEKLRKAFPNDYIARIIVTTDREKGFLRKLVNDHGYASFIVPDNVGGRFSVLSDVGLVSSAFAGIDIKALLKGAAAMRKRCAEANLMNNPAYLNGLLHYLYMKQGKNISVMMPYANSLYDFADWYRQLWAESLGKRKDLKGRDIFVGQTPVKALGSTDQHSQVQLYVEGPNDKVVTFLKVENFAVDYTIPNLHPDREEVNYLGGKTLSQLLNAEALATSYALTSAGRPNCTISFPQVDEFHLGEFIMMYMIQTVFTGKLLHINPLDQPGVEAGKNATYMLMGKKGYENYLTDLKID